MKINEIINHPQLSAAKQLVDLIDNDMIGRVALNKEHQATHVLYIIKELMGDNCNKVLDIGTLWGGSIMTMMQSSYKSYFVSIDFFDGYYKSLTGFSEDPVCGGTNTVASVDANIRRHNKHNHSYDLIEGSSHNSKIVKKVHSILDNNVDLLFIDGDHTKDGVIQDWNDYSKLVNSGGVVIFDDHWSDELSNQAWKNKAHWQEPERMDIVGAYEEIKSRPNFADEWIELGLFVDKMIVQKR